MGKPSRDKGLRNERQVVDALQEAGIGAERVPLSGAAGGKFVGDVSLPVKGSDWVAEVKVRATGFTQIYDWLGAHDALFIRRDRSQWLVVLPMHRFMELAK